MTAAQRASFARDGYLLVPGALSRAETAALNAQYDHVLTHEAELVFGEENTRQTQGAVYDETGRDSTRRLNVAQPQDESGWRLWNEAFMALIDHPATDPLLTDILADPALGLCHPATPPELRHQIRLDKDHYHVKPPAAGEEDSGGSLHGSPWRWHVTALWELEDIAPSSGGVVRHDASLFLRTSIGSLTDESVRLRRPSCPARRSRAMSCRRRGHHRATLWMFEGPSPATTTPPGAPTGPRSTASAAPSDPNPTAPC